MLRSKIILPGLAMALAGGAFAQGDTPSTATPIGTTGSFALDSTALTTSGFDGGATCAAGASTINQDGFWQWTAPAAGAYKFDTFGSSFDTKISVHSGVGAAATCSGYNDDAGGGTQSETSLLGLSSGDMVLIQAGGYGTNSGIGSLNITSFVPPPANANDDCSLAAVIGTVGSFAYDSSGATTSGFDGAAACGATSNAINEDIFWQWTAPAGGDYEFDTFGSSYDTMMSVHAGIGCAAVCVDHNDDSGTLQSRVTATGVAMGDTFLIQVGGYGVGGTLGMLNINNYTNPCIPDDAFEENDDCGSATPMADGTYTSLMVFDTDLDHYSFCVPDNGALEVDILFLQAQADMDLVLWDASDVNCGTGHGGGTFLAEGWSATDNENLVWDNFTGADVDVILEVNLYSGSCNIYDLVIVGSGNCGGTPDTGTPFCDPASANSTGAPAVLAGTTGSGVGADLHLEITSGPVGQLAYMLAGNEATAGIPVSNGLFCLVGTPTAQFFRYNVAGTDMNSIGGFDGTGTWINVSSTSTTGFGFDVPATIPAGVPIVITAGDTWQFQGWYRDTAAASGSSNFTNGLSVTF
jgi:hypothetical protein